MLKMSRKCKDYADFESESVVYGRYKKLNEYLKRRCSELGTNAELKGKSVRMQNLVMAQKIGDILLTKANERV